MNDYPANPYQAPKTTHTYAPDNVAPGEVVLAERATRLGASLLDGIIQVCLILLVAVPIFYSKGIEELAIWIDDNDILSSVLAFALTFSVYAVVNFYLLNKNGQTIGKYVCGIKIVRSDGSRANVERILFLRFAPVTLLQALPTIGPFIALIDALMIFRDSRKCLHDDIADTIVIKA